MVQIAVLLLAFPIGLGRWSRRTALLATTALVLVLLVPQTISVRNDMGIDWIYWVVQVITLAVGLGLTSWGHAWSSKRRARRAAAVPAGTSLG